MRNQPIPPKSFLLPDTLVGSKIGIAIDKHRHGIAAEGLLKPAIVAQGGVGRIEHGRDAAVHLQTTGGRQCDDQQRHADRQRRIPEANDPASRLMRQASPWQMTYHLRAAAVGGVCHRIRFERLGRFISFRTRIGGSATRCAATPLDSQDNVLISAWQSDRHWLLAIVVMALLLRGTIAAISLPRFSGDPDAYRAIAETLAQTGVYGLTDQAGEGRPTAFRPPLYPYLLSWITIGGQLSNLAVAALHTLLGTWTVALTFVAGRRLLGPTYPPGTSAVAAALVAVDPILVQQSTWVMTETLATTLAIAVIWYGSAGDELPLGRTCLLGLLLSLAFLCRPTFLVWAAMICVALWWVKRPVAPHPESSPVVSDPPPNVPRNSSENSWSLTDRLWRSGTVAAIVLATVGLWSWRNARVLGHPIWATTHGGYTLLLGNNPLFYDYLRSSEIAAAWDPGPFLVAYSYRYQDDPDTDAFWREERKSPAISLPQVSEHEDDRVSYGAARATIDREPAMFLWSCGVRLARLWTPLPHRTADRSWLSVAVIGGYYGLFYLAMSIGLWRIGHSGFAGPWWPILTLVITLSIVHSIYWSNMRMRAPIVPGLAIIAAAGIGKRRPLPTVDDTPCGLP